MNPGRKLLSRQLAFGVLLVLALGISVFYTYTRAGVPTRVYAAPASTLNFQARLMSSSGAIVADGSYSVAFNLYNDPLTGASQWTETQAVTVKSGYLSVYLGSSSAFPSTIDWSQAQYLTMNVNGDGEMNPRLKLTAVPFAFQAGTALAVKSFDTNALSTHSSDVSISTGDALGLTSNSGNLTIDTGNATGTTGAITIGGGYASSLTLGRSGLQTTVAGNALVQGGSLAIGTTGQAGSLQISDGSSNTVTLTASGVGTDYNLTLPTAAPAVDQCLRTNSSTASQLEFGACGTRKVQQSYTAYGVNQAANATTALNYFFPTTTTTFNLTTALSAEVKMSRAGSFRSCSIYSSAAVTAGSVSVHFRKNGADVSATNYCTLNTTNTRSIAQDIDPGIVTFSAGDTIGVALVSTGLTPTTLEHRVDFTVEFGTGSDSGIYKLQDAYNNSSAVELSVDSVRGGLTVRDNIISIGSNLLEVQNSNGSTTYFGVSATGLPRRIR